MILGIILCVVVGCSQAKSSASPQISAEEVKSLINDPSAILLDVRTVREFRDGHIPGAMNIPLRELPGRISELDKSKDIVVYCRTGNRSSVAFRFLQQAGFGKLKDYSGSFREWSSKNYPVEKP